METKRSRLSWSKANLDSPLQTAILACLVATLSYLAPRLEGALILHPQTVWPLWPGCALLVSVLLLVPRRIWPILIPVSFAAFVLYDLQAGVPIGSIAWFIPADTVQVLIAAFCLSYFFGGVPRLHSVRNMATYSFFAVLLAPSAAAFLSAFGVLGDYWTSWRTSFLSEVLAFVTLTLAGAIVGGALSGHFFGAATVGAAATPKLLTAQKFVLVDSAGTQRGEFARRWQLRGAPRRPVRDQRWLNGLAHPQGDRGRTDRLPR